MNDDVTQRTQPAGRTIKVFVFGDTADEIEISALDEARKFFGANVRLEVVRDYEVLTVLPNGFLAGQANGKAWHASVPVRTVEP